MPGAYNFYNITNTAKQGDQDLYSGLTAEYRTDGNWHNLVRYGIARKREQQTQFGNVGNPITYNFGTEDDPDYFTEYFGNVVNIRGANGYTATGQVAFLTGTDDQSSNRDQLYYQSDWSRSPLFNVLFGFRYDNERGSYNNAEFFEHEIIQRTNYEWNLQFQGEVKGRFSYSLGGAIEKNHLYGIAGTPRIGFTYVPVRPSSKLFHGTRIRANYATGVQEPTLALEFNSLYTQLLEAGDLEDIEKYHIGPQGAQRSRTYDAGVDQNILGEKLVLRAGYFHNMFDHQLEGVSSSALAQYFGIGTPCPPPETGTCPLPSIFTAYVNSQAYRAQGAELELQWQPTSHILVRGGYTYLDTVVIAVLRLGRRRRQPGHAHREPQHPRRSHRCGGPARWCASLPSATEHGLHHRAVHAAQVLRRVPRRLRQPQRRLHLPRRPHSQLRQLDAAAQPRPRLQLRQARPRRHLCHHQPFHCLRAVAESAE